MWQVDTRLSERLTACMCSVEAIHGQNLLSYYLQVAYVPEIMFYFKEVFNCWLDSVAYYDTQEKEQRFSRSG
jgi:hypothetical protein